MLKERGVKDVRALRGGWNQWFNEGNPIEKGRKAVRQEFREGRREGANDEGRRSEG